MFNNNLYISMIYFLIAVISFLIIIFQLAEKQKVRGNFRIK